MTRALRSQIYLVDEPEGEPPQHYYVVISNNLRNRALPNVLALMVTSTNKSDIDTAVQLSREDPVAGWVVADNIVKLWEDELTRPGGYMSRNTMQKIEGALRIALAIP